MTLETDKTKIKPVEKIPAEWYQALTKFLDGFDPSGLTIDMFDGAVTEKELARFKDLYNRQEVVGRLEDARQQENSPLKLSKEEWKEFSGLDAKISWIAEALIRKINPFWPDQT